MEKIDYNNAKFSLAMIDFKNYTDFLLSLDLTLDDANFLYNHVMNKKEKTQDLVDILRKYSFTEFAKVQKRLIKIENEIKKYQFSLHDYLQENVGKQEEFNSQLDILIPLLQEYKKSIENKIQKCFQYFQEWDCAVSV